MAFIFTSNVNADGATGPAVEVLKSQPFILGTEHLICLGIMREEFGAINASSLRFGPP